MAFHTESQVERWLECETRDLQMPDGSTRPHRCFRLVWEIADSLVLLDGYSYEELASFAAEEAALQQLPFDEAFKGVVSWLDEQRRERWGV